MGSTTATATKKKKPVPKTTAKKQVVNKTRPKPPVKLKPKTATATKNKSAPGAAIVPAKPENIRQNYDKQGVLPDAGIDFCGANIKGRRHTFLLYYLTPGQPCFHNAKQAGIKAGYTEYTASAEVYKILREPDIQKIVNVNEKLGYQSLHEAAKMAIEIKKQRALYKPSDYFVKKEIEVKTKKGTKIIEKVVLKPLEEMTDLQQMCVDGIEIKGTASIPIYTMPDRGKELNEIIKMDAEWSKSIADTGEEETREIIMERITVRETKRAQLPAELEYEIIKDPIEVQAEDENDV